MRILIISINDQKGGAEGVLQKIVNYYNTKNKEVFICFLKVKNYDFWRKLLDQEKIKKITLKELMKFKFDIVFSSHILTNFLIDILRFFRLVKTKVHIARESTNVFLRYKNGKLLIYKFMYFFGYNISDKVVFQTRDQLKYITNKVPKIKKKSIVIHNPFIFPNESLINEYIPSEEKYIVSIGRLIHEKGFDLLISAFLELGLKEKGYKLIILGEGHEKKNLLELINQSNLKEAVLLKGYVHNVYPYFKNANCCVVSSRVEGFPNVLLEMMSVNTNVVSTLCAGDIENINGIEKCVTNNLEALKKSINLVLSSPNKVENEEIFKKFLQERSIENFMNKINE